MSSSSPDRITRVTGARLLAVLALGLVLIGCSGSPAASTSAAPTTASAEASAPAASAAAPSASAAPASAPASAAPSEAAVCLPPEVLTAIGELASGDLDPSVPRDQLAAAVDAIDPDEIDPRLFPYHDALVNMLEKEEVNDSLSGMAADFLEISDGRIGTC